MFIIKYKKKNYKNELIWDYISNISEISIKKIDKNDYLKSIEFIEEEVDEDKENPVSELDKIYKIITEEVTSEFNNTHFKYLVYDYYGVDESPIYSILLRIEDNKEYEYLLLINDQETYLMNEKGEIIEKII